MGRLAAVARYAPIVGPIAFEGRQLGIPSDNNWLLQLTKAAESDVVGPDAAQFSVVGFSGPVTLIGVGWWSTPESSLLLVQFHDTGDSPYDITYTPAGEGAPQSIVGVDGSIGGPWVVEVNAS